jgi:hypothetical protein
LSANSDQVISSGSTEASVDQGGRDRGYLFVLILIAAGVLAGGIWLRPKHAPPAPKSEAEVLRLQMQAQKREMERRSLFFSVRARELVSLAEQARVRPESVSSEGATAGQRLIVVAASPGAEPLWIDTAVAGESPASCYGMIVEEIVTSSVLPRSFVGGAAFNLDNALVGIVHDCGQGNVLLTPEAFAAQARQLPARKLYEAAGLRVRIEQEPGPPGVRVLEVRRSSSYAAAGLQAGDLITQANEVSVRTIDQLNSIIQSADLQIRVVRGTREITINRQEHATGSGVRWLDSGRAAEVVSVAPGSAGAKWGLRSGDVILRAGVRRSPRPGVINDLVSRFRDVDLVVLRGGSELLLEHPK